MPYVETAINRITVQDEKIIDLQSQVSSLCERFNIACGLVGILPDIQQKQASYPRGQVKWLWCAIGIMALGIVEKFLIG